MRDEIFTAQDELVTKPKVLAYLEKQKNLEGDFARGYDSGYANCLQSHGAEWFEKQKEQKYTHEGPLTAVPFHKPEEGVEYDMYFEDAQEYIEKRGFNIPWNDGNVFIDEDYMTQTVANVLKWADEHPIKQKLAGWNEEDLATIKDLKETITSSGTWHVITPAQASAYLKWLIGLERSGNPKQAAWKPSEDQLKCLFNAENVLRKHNYIAIAYKIEELHYCLEQLKQS